MSNNLAVCYSSAGSHPNIFSSGLFFLSIALKALLRLSGFTRAEQDDGATLTPAQTEVLSDRKMEKKISP